MPRVPPPLSAVEVSNSCSAAPPPTALLIAEATRGPPNPAIMALVAPEPILLPRTLISASSARPLAPAKAEPVAAAEPAASLRAEVREPWAPLAAINAGLRMELPASVRDGTREPAEPRAALKASENVGPGAGVGAIPLRTPAVAADMAPERRDVVRLSPASKLPTVDAAPAAAIVAKTLRPGMNDTANGSPYFKAASITEKSGASLAVVIHLSPDCCMICQLASAPFCFEIAVARAAASAAASGPTPS